MNQNSRWRRRGLLLTLCLAVTTLTWGALAFAQSGGGGAVVHLPIIIGVEPSTGGGTLANGGAVEGPDGVGVGTFTDTLEAPITVWISRTSAPGVALPPQAQLLGGYYQIGADENVYVDTESPFLLAFPVPPGADTGNLALAKLTSGEHVDDADPALQAWSVLEGMYDPGQNLFLTTVAGLHAGGNAFVLVTHPDFDAPPNGTIVAQPEPAHSQSGMFTAECVHFDNPNDCTASIENQVADFATDMYGRFQQDLGFEDPRIRNEYLGLYFLPNAMMFGGYKVYIEPNDYGFCHSGNAGGYYEPLEGRLVLCLNPALGLNPQYVHVLIHEYFHATEYGYQAAFNDLLLGRTQKWIKEGMAKSAEESYFVDEMMRTEVSGWEKLHKVDKSLTSTDETDEYDAQDFWVFYGQQNGEYLPYLQDVLQEGLQTEDVVNVLGDGDYLKPYWDWAKNQVMEKQINFDGVLQSPCFVEEQVVQQYEIFEHVWTDKLYHDVVVSPLSTLVVELTFSDIHDYAYGWVSATNRDQLPDADLALEYKFYEDGQNGCEAVPDGPREWPHGEGVTPGKTYYVLISNTDYDDSYEYTIAFELSTPD